MSMFDLGLFTGLVVGVALYRFYLMFFGRDIIGRLEKLCDYYEERIKESNNQPEYTTPCRSCGIELSPGRPGWCESCLDDEQSRYAV